MLHVQVLANDLNPSSFKYLQQNIQLNKVQSKVQAFNMDGRSFVRHLCSPQPVIPAASGAAQPERRLSAGRNAADLHASFVEPVPFDASICCVYATCGMQSYLLIYHVEQVSFAAKASLTSLHPWTAGPHYSCLWCMRT